MGDAPMTVVETMEFLQRANRLMSESDRADLVVFLASNPEAGVIVPETGGVRKMRWALPGMGKRGGARVIYYYHNQTVPIFLLSAYAKNQKANLSAADLKAMKSLVRSVVASYPRKP